MSRPLPVQTNAAKKLFSPGQASPRLPKSPRTGRSSPGTPENQPLGTSLDGTSVSVSPPSRLKVRLEKAASPDVGTIRPQPIKKVVTHMVPPEREPGSPVGSEPGSPLDDAQTKRKLKGREPGLPAITADCNNKHGLRAFVVPSNSVMFCDLCGDECAPPADFFGCKTMPLRVLFDVLQSSSRGGSTSAGKAG